MTVREIAKIAKVSPATISLVLNNQPGVGDEKRQEILGLLKELHFPLSERKTRNKPQKKDFLFIKFFKSGYLVEENAGFISRIMDSVQQECSKLNCTLRMQVFSNNFSASIKSTDFSSICGVFVIGTELSPEDYPALSQIPVPYIVIDNSMPNFPCHSITMQNEEMAYSAVKYLAQAKPSSFGYLHSKLNAQNFQERLKGVLSATKDFSLSLAKEHIFLLDPTLQDSYRNMKEYLENHADIPTSLFADNDIIAIGAIKALQEFGYRIPQDIAIIGFDDVYLSATATPPLTTIHVQRTLIGRLAVMQLNDAITQSPPSHVKLKVGGDLVIRESTLKIN